MPEHHQAKFDRVKYLLLMSCAVAILLIARWLRPSLRGVGTHEQLGLPPCLFLQLTGVPCPNCGLTTSFAYAARFEFLQSFLTQPFGLLAFSLTVLIIPVTVYLLKQRVGWNDLVHAKRFDPLMYMLVAVYLLSWFYKIAVMT